MINEDTPGPVEKQESAKENLITVPSDLQGFEMELVTYLGKIQNLAGEIAGAEPGVKTGLDAAICEKYADCYNWEKPPHVIFASLLEKGLKNVIENLQSTGVLPKNYVAVYTEFRECFDWLKTTFATLFAKFQVEQPVVSADTMPTETEQEKQERLTRARIAELASRGVTL